MLNKVQLIGNLGKDPELKQFQNGGSICNISVATTEKAYTTKNGTQVDAKTEWHNVVFNNRLAEVANEYLHKGSKIYVEGKLTTRSYETQDGVTKYVTEIRATNMEMLDSKPQNQQQGGYAQQQPQNGYQQPQQQPQQAPQQQPPQQQSYQQQPQQPKNNPYKQDAPFLQQQQQQAPPPQNYDNGMPF